MFLLFMGELLLSREFAMACSVVFAIIAIYCAVRLHTERKANAYFRALDAEIIQEQENIICMDSEVIRASEHISRIDAEIAVINERIISEQETENDQLRRRLMMEGALPWNDSSNDSYDD